MNETSDRQNISAGQYSDAHNKKTVFQGVLYTFHGGVHPEEHKNASSGRPIMPVFIPTELIVSVQQHIGEAGRPCVAVGDHVDAGQIIAQADGYMSVATHAPTSGHSSSLTDIVTEGLCSHQYL